RETGTLRVAEDDGVARELRHRVSWERERGLGVRWLEPAELASREPLLHEGLSGALFSADDHQVTSSALTHALARRAAARGAIVVGATVEDVGFDWAPREEATRSLLDRAFRLIPALRDAEVLDAWAGLRPGTPDRLPIIGVRRDAQGLIFATGHFRNGVLLSLITGRIVAAIAAGEPSALDIAAVSPERFA